MTLGTVTTLSTPNSLNPAQQFAPAPEADALETVDLIGTPIPSSMSVCLSKPEDYEALLRDYDTWLFDCDGVLWRGDNLIEGVTDVLDLLRRRSMFALFPNIQRLRVRTFLKIRRWYSSRTTPQNRGEATKPSSTN